jgi:hypothetical protein
MFIGKKVADASAVIAYYGKEIFFTAKTIQE